MTHLPFALSLEYAEDLISALDADFNFNQHELSKAKALLESSLPPLVRPELLAFLFGVSDRLIMSMSRYPQNYYRTYEIEKKSGGYRTIEAPRRFLKIVQRWIHIHILLKQSLPPYVTGFVPTRNIFSNSQPHLPHKNLMVVDIRNFFPSIKRYKITHFFEQLGFPSPVSYCLSGLCTLRQGLPQGAPTSPALANLIFQPVDSRLYQLAKDWDCAYTRYADDIAFSGNTTFHNNHISKVAEILSSYQFKVNSTKSRIVGSGGRQLLTGLVVNQTGLPPRYKRMRWRAIFHQAKMHPERFVGHSSMLDGFSAFVNEYDPVLAKSYFEISQRVIELEP